MEGILRGLAPAEPDLQTVPGPQDSVSYPLSSSGPRLRHLRSGLCEFAEVLVECCRHSFLYDEYLFPSLLSLLTGLSDSQVRAFRHTSTLLGEPRPLHLDQEL